jgi:hypothetical protein
VALNGMSSATYRPKWHREGAGQGERFGIDIPMISVDFTMRTEERFSMMHPPTVCG